MGGLGFRNLNDFNLSLLVKMCWRIIQQPEDLLVQVLKGLYFGIAIFYMHPRVLVLLRPGAVF
ncbi:hypothetical protein RchiOBHm_Chr3g0457301 [Rosa chinensis]|uniref:Uncharacterized protein n=1 Tax=Rosa chinensis TaxID=74649 RepID=A0A2P6R7J4_ROSCH|nr:hypothetical protein RchiOBHm_Chr3g0457301 [Rosa chinensis]